MSEARRKKVEAAVRVIEAFHAKGRGILAQRSRDSASGKVRRKAKGGGHTTEKEMYLKACQFADPTRGGYSPEKLAALCQLIRDTQPDQEDNLKIFSRTHVLYLLTVRGSRREKFQRKAVQHGWSSRVLLREIGADQGTRREGGRNRPLPTNRTGLLGAIEKECERWRRMNLAVNRGDPGGRKPADLIADLEQRFEDVCAAVQDFQEAVTLALSVEHPKRHLRKTFQEQATDPTGPSHGRKQTRKKRPT